ncbi:MAG: hypothetical protein WBQ75_13770 [Acetobacteraceae bacterium]
MHRRETFNVLPKRLTLACVLPLSLAGIMALSLAGAPVPSARAQEAARPTAGGAAPGARKYVPATIHAEPGLQCRLSAPGGSAADSLPVFSDADGYIRFLAVRPASDAVARTLVIKCKDAAGKPVSYTVNLASAATFAPHPLNLAEQPGTVRPALKGNPLSYTQAQLAAGGYGLRPDPAKAPAAYAQWLHAASLPGRALSAPRPNPHPHTVTVGTAAPWVGSVMTGAPNYILSQAVFNVPTGIAGGDGTTSAWIAIWNGIGGYGTGSGLIQGGVDLKTIPQAASYLSFQEYCCGDPGTTPNAGAFQPAAGDQIFSQEYYCDANGNAALNGGYGCTFLQDMTSGAIQSCTLASGSPCESVPAFPLCSVNPTFKNCMTLGSDAEFIVENTSPQLTPPTTAFPDFTPAIVMAGSATSSAAAGRANTISTDPSVQVLTDFTSGPTHIVVTLGSPNQTIFAIEPAQPSYPLYCQGPLATSTAPTPLTPFTWASKGAGAAPPGAGQCAWADRGPRAIEIKPGGGNLISGFLNQVASLPMAKFMAVGVYRDPAARNDMVVTKVVGFVTPPFSAAPVVP